LLDDEELVQRDDDSKKDTDLDTGDDQDKDPDKDDTGLDPIPSGDPAFVKELKSNQYGFFCDIFIQSGSQTGTLEGMYTRYGDMFACQWDEMLYIYKNGLVYVCDTYEETYFKMSSGMDELALLFEYMQRSGEGTADLNGWKTNYIDYSSDGVTVRFFLEGDDVKAFQYDLVEEGQVYTLTCTITHNLHTFMADMFDPSRWTEVSPPQ